MVIGDVAVGVVVHQHGILHTPVPRDDHDSMVEAAKISGHNGIGVEEMLAGGKSAKGYANSISTLRSR